MFPQINDTRKLMIFLTIVLLFTLCFIFIQSFFTPKYFSKNVKMDSVITIINRTDKLYLDTVINVGAHLLNMKDIKVYIHPMNSTINSNIIDSNKRGVYLNNVNKFYYIWVDTLDRGSIIKLLTHELLHMQQYYNNELLIADSVITWHGIPYDKFKTNMITNPWELDVNLKQNKFKNKLNRTLYE